MIIYVTIAFGFFFGAYKEGSSILNAAINGAAWPIHLVMCLARRIKLLWYTTP